MYLNHDLAKAIIDDRRARAEQAAQVRQARASIRARFGRREPDQAEVIELVFGRHCETGQIGA